MQSPLRQSHAERVEPGFGFTVMRIVEHQQRRIEKYLLRLSGRDAMALVLPRIAFIPIKANYL